MRPTPERAQHHDLEPPAVDALSFRPAWRIYSRLEGLLASRAITPREWLAAAAYRHQFELAIRYRSESLAEPAGKPSRLGDGNYTVRRLDALAALRAARRRIGGFACSLIEACAVDDISWRDLAACLGVDPKTARSWTILAIRALAHTTS